MRIAIAGFSDETCTFCPEPTTIDSYEPWALRGEALLAAARGIPNYINGYLTVLEAAGAEVVPLVYAARGPGGFTSWLTVEAYEKYATEIPASLAAAGKLDGVLLCLHGAMAATGTPKPEAELVRRCRAVVGKDVPIMVTLDLHANEDHELTDAADAVFVLKTYPHVDSQEIGETAARCMLMTVRGEFKPTQALRKPGIVSASIYQASSYHPMKAVFDRCREWELRPDVFCVSCAPGYAYADVVDIGMSVIAVTNNDQALADRIADDVAALAWSLREALTRPLPKTEEGVAQLMRLVAGGTKPVLVADGADRTGDSTWILAELIKQGAINWVVPGIADAKAAALLEKHSVGDRVKVTVGGWASEFSGSPVTIEGVIEYAGRPEYRMIGPMMKGQLIKEGFTARINLGQNRHVGVSADMRVPLDASGILALGLDPDRLDIIVLKDRVHHRAYWDDHVKLDFPIDAPGLGPADLSLLSYKNAPANAYPIGSDWRGGAKS